MNISLICRLLFYPALMLITLMALLPQEQVVVTVGWDKANHALAFFLLLSLLDNAYLECRLIWTKCSLLFAYGVLVEVLQAYIPSRFPSAMDIAADTVGMALYCLVKPIFITRLSLLSNRGCNKASE